MQKKRKTTGIKQTRVPQSLSVKSISAAVALVIDSFTSQGLLCMRFCMFIRGQSSVSLNHLRIIRKVWPFTQQSWDCKCSCLDDVHNTHRQHCCHFYIMSRAIMLLSTASGVGSQLILGLIHTVKTLHVAV